MCAPPPAKQVEHCTKLQAWMLRVASEIRPHVQAGHLQQHAVPLPAAAADEPPLPTAKAVLAWQAEQRQVVDSKFDQAIIDQYLAGQQPCSSTRTQAPPLPRPICLSVYHLTLVDFMLSHIPPQRCEVVMSLKVDWPSFGFPCRAAAKCDDTTCTTRACRGNRIVQLEQQFNLEQPHVLRAGSDVLYKLTPYKLQVVVEHHKTSHCGKEAIEFQLPYALTMSLHQYLNYARPALLLECADDDGFLFPNPNNGSRLTHQSMNNLWEQLQDHHSAPWQHFTPSQNRKIFATFQVEALAAEVAASAQQRLVGETHVMGNSPRVLMSHYAKGTLSTLAQEAINNLSIWREACLLELQLGGAVQGQGSVSQGGSAQRSASVSTAGEDEEWEDGRTQSGSSAQRTATSSVSTAGGEDEWEHGATTSVDTDSMSVTSSIEESVDGDGSGQGGDPRAGKLVSYSSSTSGGRADSATPSVQEVEGGRAKEEVFLSCDESSDHGC